MPVVGRSESYWYLAVQAAMLASSTRVAEREEQLHVLVERVALHPGQRLRRTAPCARAGTRCSARPPSTRPSSSAVSDRLELSASAWSMSAVAWVWVPSAFGPGSANCGGYPVVGSSGPKVVIVLPLRGQRLLDRVVRAEQSVRERRGVAATPAAVSTHSGCQRHLSLTVVPGVDVSLRRCSRWCRRSRRAGWSRRCAGKAMHGRGGRVADAGRGGRGRCWCRPGS